MNATEVFVEQVLIGLLVLAIFAVPFAPELCALFPASDGGWKLLEGSLVIGAAYLIGIPCDRLADTTMDRLERHHRARCAYRILGSALTDPLPEHELSLRLRTESATANRYAEYLRTRIRLSRALAIYAPGLAVAGALRLGEVDGFLRLLVLALLIACHGVAFLACLVPSDVPRTDERCKLEAYGAAKFLRSSPHTALATWSLLDDVLRDRATRCGIALISLAALVAVLSGAWAGLGIAASGAILAALSGWSWWRISTTYRGLLHSYDKLSS